MTTDDIYRLDGRLEECTFLADGDVRVVLRSQRTAATFELVRGVGRACVAGVLLEPESLPPPRPKRERGAPPLPSRPRPKFRFTVSPRPDEPLYWSSLAAPFPGLAKDMQVRHLRRLNLVIAEFAKRAKRATPAQGTDSPGGRPR